VVPGGEEQTHPRRKPPQRVDLTPRLELSLECEVDCEKLDSDKSLGRLPAKPATAKVRLTSRD
jgi:hypothetical protein